MIGLGSNRLSVCRRGGMSVTQAGRGGMEWLAGGRRPRWSSPYSAQATAALKAQFPTQWLTIRDYGFAHPALVPFINEDPMMVCSLGIEGLPIRWLRSEGNCYINTGFICDVNTIVDIKFRVNQAHSSRTDVFGTFISVSDGLCIWSQGNNQSLNVNSPSINYTNYKLVVGDVIDVHIEGRQAIVNGNINNLAGTFHNSAYPAYIYTMDSSGATTGNLIKASVAKLVLSQTSEGREMYPFIRNGVLGMIDVLHDVLYTNAGSGQFTEEFGYMQNGSWVPWTPAS